MIAARNILIHNYDGAEPAIVWAIVEQDLPGLLSTMRPILGDESDRLTAS